MKPMRVALETSGLYTTQAGTARYIRGLISGFEALANPALQLHELGWPVENFSFQQPARALKTFYRDIIWTKLVAPRQLRREMPDLLHSTTGVRIAPPREIGHVATVFDFGLFRFQERFRLWHRWSGQRTLRRSGQADQVICISQFTADEATKLLGIPASKLNVIYCACDFNECTHEQPPPLELPSEFFLFIGSLEPGKNLALLRDVYRLADAQGRRLPALVIIGARWAGVGTEGKAPAEWHYLGRQPDPVLVYLYRRAAALVFPSKYEGFGLPVLEAMALGCPVICSPVASLPEVGGEAVYYSKLDAASYFEALQLLSRPGGIREQLIKNGREQAKKFSWQRAAQETLNVYQATLR